jgi:uncharacterized protein YutE (UPF0331/DUF86 family)
VQDIRVIATRLKKLDAYQRGLLPFQQIPLEEYLVNENMQMIVERRLQLSIQVCIDMANYLIAHLGLRAPDSQENVFTALGTEGVISQDLAQRMVGMVQFRNILVHDYLDIDSRLVHSHLSQRLSDFDQFSRELVEQFPTLRNDGQKLQ